MFDGWPFPIAVATLTLIAFARGGATYLVGRAADAGATRTRARSVVTSPAFGRARAAVNRWGPPVVSLSFLTVGFQTMVNIAAGVCRMPARRYVPALMIGAVLWGFLYATVGFVTFAAWLTLYDHSAIGAIAFLAAVVIGIAGFVITQLRRSGDSSERLEVVDGDGVEHELR